VRRYFEEVWSNGDFSHLEELVAPDFIDHHPILGTAPDRNGQRQAVMMIQQGMPDHSVTVELLLAEGDLVADRWVSKGTHTGELFGIPPSNKTLKMSGMDIFRIENGKIKEVWHEEDTMGFMQQLGVIPTPGQEQQRAA
jgi:steroid delta-isomerase-like uncharacterized protein